MEKKQRKLNNEGFSLIELIVVIAIMAILVGALAPQLLKYIQRAREAQDVQAVGAIYTAVTTAYADPDVTSGKPTAAGTVTLTTTSPAALSFSAEVLSTLGGAMPTYSSDEYNGKTPTINYLGNGQFTVVLAGDNKTVTVSSSGSAITATP